MTFQDSSEKFPAPGQTEPLWIDQFVEELRLTVQAFQYLLSVLNTKFPPTGA